MKVNHFEKALLESLRSAPLLIGDLPEAPCFDRSLVAGPPLNAELNFNQKLGHLYEDALEALLDASDQVELLASSLQVFDPDGRTLGELDFLLHETAGGQRIHLELAVKFYLAVERDGEWQFPGPDPRDNWQRKLERMRSHQFVLSQTPAAKMLLRERFGIESFAVRQLIYGCLFYPMSSEARPLPEAVAADCRIGRWLYVSEWENYFPDVEFVLIVPKPMWPVEIGETLKTHLETISIDELKALAQERCTLFVRLNSKEPIFLVPDDWLKI
ncbi:MAG: DUF1853 family protein [Lentimonas sp.]